MPSALLGFREQYGLQMSYVENNSKLKRVNSRAATTPVQLFANSSPKGASLLLPYFPSRCNAHDCHLFFTQTLQNTPCTLHTGIRWQNEYFQLIEAAEYGVKWELCQNQSGTRKILGPAQLVILSSDLISNDGRRDYSDDSLQSLSLSLITHL